MASISSYGVGAKKRYRVRLRDAAGREHSRSFLLQKDAKSHATEMDRRKQLGALYVAPAEAFGRYADDWYGKWVVQKRPSVSQADTVKRNLEMHLAPLRGLLIEQITAAFFEDTILKIAQRRPRTAHNDDPRPET